MLSDLRCPATSHLTFWRATKSTLYSLIVLVMHFRAPGLYRDLMFHVPNRNAPSFPVLVPIVFHKLSIIFQGLVVVGFLTMVFYCDGSLARRQTPNLEV